MLFSIKSFKSAKGNSIVALFFVLAFLGYSCSQPNRESQWMNIPRDSSAIAKKTKLDTLLQPKADSIQKNDSVVVN